MQSTFVLCFCVSVAALQQDGTEGSLVREASQFLIPPPSVIDKYTLGARKEPTASILGRDFAYNCTNGVRDWGMLGFPRCELGEQSPINLKPELMPVADSSKDARNIMTIDFSRSMFTAGNEFLLNLTTIQPRTNITKSNSAGKPNFIHFTEDGAEYARRIAYELKRVEFHHPAEHLVNGVRFEVEIQLHLQSEHGELMSVAVFAHSTSSNFISQEMREFSESIFPTIPEMGSTSVDLDPSIFLPRLEGFWSYSGSHTSPPCLNNVKWIVMQHPINVSRDFIFGVKQMVTARYFGGNARDVREKEPGFEVVVRSKPSAGGELLLTSPTSLTPSQLRTLRPGSKIEWNSEATVVDIARMWTRFHGVQSNAPVTDGIQFEDEWSVLLYGRPTEDNVVVPKWVQLSAAEIEGTVYGSTYRLTDKCLSSYVWEHRFISVTSSEGCARSANGTMLMNSPGCSKSRSKMNPPLIPPGSHLLQPTIAPQDADLQISNPSLRGFVEQIVKPTDDSVIHIPPQW